MSEKTDTYSDGFEKYLIEEYKSFGVAVHYILEYTVS